MVNENLTASRQARKKAEEKEIIDSPTEQQAETTQNDKTGIAFAEKEAEEKQKEGLENEQIQASNDALKNDEQKDKIYPTASTVFDICKSEFENEKNRTNTIDSKIAIVTAIVTAILLLIAETTDFETLFSRTISSVRDLIPAAILIILVFGSILLISTALIFLILSILTREYRAIDPRWFLQTNNLDDEKSIHFLVCADKYMVCCENNRKVNDKRSKKYDTAVRLLAIGVIAFLLFFVLKFFL